MTQAHMHADYRKYKSLHILREAIYQTIKMTESPQKKHFKVLTNAKIKGKAARIEK